MIESLYAVLEKNALIMAFLFVGVLVWFSYEISARLTRGQLHGSAIAITLGLMLAYFGRLCTGKLLSESGFTMNVLL